MTTLSQALKNRVKNIEFTSAPQHKFDSIPTHCTFQRTYFKNEVFGASEFFKALVNGFSLNSFYYYAGSMVEAFIQHEKILHAAVFPYDDGISNDLTLPEIEAAIARGESVGMCDLNEMMLVMQISTGLYCYIEMDADSKCGGIGFFESSDTPEQVVKNMMNDNSYKCHGSSEDSKIIVVSGEYLKNNPFDGGATRTSKMLESWFQETMEEQASSK